MKSKKMLFNFLAIMLIAILLGIVAGRYLSVSGAYIILTPLSYMQGLVYLSPLFMIPALVGLIVYIGGRGRYPKLPFLLSAYVYMLIGVIVSGFCGLYTMADFVPVALGLITGLFVLMCLVLAGKHSHQRIFISTDYSWHILPKAGFGLYGAVVTASAFLPIGPLPVIIIGTVAVFTILSK